MKSSRRDLFIDVVVDRFIFNYNEITLTFVYPKQVWDYLKQAFYCVVQPFLTIRE